MHNGTEHGTYQSDWKSAVGLTCQKCQSHDIMYREWESSDGAYDDTKYHCESCGYFWWVDGPDA